MQPSSEPFVSFYLGQSTDSNGRRLEEIWSWNYDELEYVHDYIQWLFPLWEKSMFNPDAPLLNQTIVDAFRSNAELRQRLLHSFKLMLAFYGLQLVEKTVDDVTIVKSNEYVERSKDWLTPGNHNYLRITRILTSLRCLGLEKYSRAFLESLEQIYGQEGYKIGQKTLRFWQNAVKVG